MLDYPGDSNEYSLNCFQYDCEQFYWKLQTTEEEPAQTEDKIQTMKIKADRQHDIMTNSIVLLQREQPVDVTLVTYNISQLWSYN